MIDGILKAAEILETKNRTGQATIPAEKNVITRVPSATVATTTAQEKG